MAILMMEGFDSLVATSGANLVTELGVSKGLLYTSAGNGPSRVTGRLAGYALTMSHGGSGGATEVWTPVVDFPSGYASGVFGCAALVTGTGGLFRLLDTNSVAMDITLAASTITVSYDPAGTTNDIASVSTVLLSSGASFSFLEFAWSSTSFSIAQNGTVIYTKAMTSFAGIRKIECRTLAGGTGVMTLDDVYAKNDSTRLGDVAVRYLSLASTTSNTGTLTGASGHAALNTFDGATTKIAFDVTQEATLTVGDISTTPATVHAVQLLTNAQKSDAGSASMSVYTTTASKQTVQTVTDLTAGAYTARRIVLASDPHDAAAWTKTRVNSLSVSVDRSA